MSVHGSKRFLQPLPGMLESAKSLQAVDVACGKCDLSLIIAQRFPQLNVTSTPELALQCMQITAVDVNQEALNQASSTANDLGLTNFRVVLSCAGAFSQQHVDLVVGLHACGGLADRALHLAEQHSSSFLVYSGGIMSVF